MYSSQAVTAEGLFRASLDYLHKSPISAVNDCRVRYETAIVRGRQGLLLSKWEKREAEGKALVVSSEAAIAKEYAGSSSSSITMDRYHTKRRILLSLSLQIPFLL